MIIMKWVYLFLSYFVRLRTDLPLLNEEIKKVRKLNPIWFQYETYLSLHRGKLSLHNFHILSPSIVRIDPVESPLFHRLYTIMRRYPQYEESTVMDYYCDQIFDNGFRETVSVAEVNRFITKNKSSLLIAENKTYTLGKNNLLKIVKSEDGTTALSFDYIPYPFPEGSVILRNGTKIIDLRMLKLIEN